MRVSHHDIMSAREWAAAHAGEDDPLDVMAHKLLQLIGESHESSKGYHDRQRSEIDAALEEIEKRFKVEDEEF